MCMRKCDLGRRESMEKCLERYNANVNGIINGIVWGIPGHWS